MDNHSSAHAAQVQTWMARLPYHEHSDGWLVERRHVEALLTDLAQEQTPQWQQLQELVSEQRQMRQEHGPTYWRLMTGDDWCAKVKEILAGR